MATTNCPHKHGNPCGNMLPITFGDVRLKFCIVPALKQSKVAPGHSPGFYTTITNVPYDVSSMPSISAINPPPPPLCTLAQQAKFLSVVLFTKTFTVDCTSEVFLILLNARSFLSKFGTLRRSVQNHFYDIIMIPETWLAR